MAESKRTLGKIRGKYSGALKVPQAEVTMDYDMLLSEGNKEKEDVLNRLDERLKRLAADTQLEKAALS